MPQPEETRYRAEELDRRVASLAGEASDLKKDIRKGLCLEGLEGKVRDLSRDLLELRTLCTSLVASIEGGDPLVRPPAPPRRPGGLRRMASRAKSLVRRILGRIRERPKVREPARDKRVGGGLPKVLPFLDLDSWDTPILDSMREALKQQSWPAIEWIEWSKSRGRCDLVDSDARLLEELEDPSYADRAAYLWEVGREVLEEPPTLLETLRVVLAAESLDFLLFGRHLGGGWVVRTAAWSSDRRRRTIAMKGRRGRQLALGVDALAGSDLQYGRSQTGVASEDLGLRIESEPLSSIELETDSSQPTTLLLITSPLIGGLERWVAGLLRESRGRRLVVLAARGGSALADRRRMQLRRICPRVYATEWFSTDPRPDLLALIARRWEIDSILLIGEDRHDSWGIHKESSLSALRRIALPITVPRHGVSGLDRFDEILAVSEQQLSRLEQSGVAQERLHRIGMPAVSIESTTATREDLGLGPESIVITMISDWFSENRPEDFMAIANHLRNRSDLRFVLVGEGPLAPRLADLYRYLDLENFSLISRSRPDRDWLSVTDIACTTSEREPFPYFVVEARSLGLPVVAADCIGLAELEDPGIALHRPGDIEGFARTLLALTSEELSPCPQVEGKNRKSPWDQIASLLGE